MEISVKQFRNTIKLLPAVVIASLRDYTTVIYGGSLDSVTEEVTEKETQKK